MTGRIKGTVRITLKAVFVGLVFCHSQGEQFKILLFTSSNSKNYPITAPKGTKSNLTF